MKRRRFGLLAGVSAGALFASGEKRAVAQTTPDVSLLKTTLTPVGAERAGNAAGTIPAWTGGLTEIPAGFDWDPDRTLPPDFFASDAMLYEVNAGNMDKYTDILSDGLQAFIQKQGFSMKVYPTRRTAALPQWVYDYIVENVGRAQLNPAGGRLGFTGGFGGAPFPIPDVNDPFAAGAQIVWNHQARWSGAYYNYSLAAHAISNGQVDLSQGANANYYYPFYDRSKTVDNFGGYFWKVASDTFAPSTVAGGQLINYTSTNPLVNVNITWQVLAGQGRVRKAPEVSYDTPDQFTDGTSGYDEVFGYAGAMDRFDWKYLGKKEMLIPYNNNKMLNTSCDLALGPKYINPEYVRWELHRVWVVEARLHPGERNVLPHRKLYINEDNWIVGVSDSWDASGNIAHLGLTTNGVFPNLPGTIMIDCYVFNLQTGDYCSIAGTWGNAPFNKPATFTPVDASMFEPQAMAAGASY